MGEDEVLVNNYEKYAIVAHYPLVRQLLFRQKSVNCNFKLVIVSNWHPTPVSVRLELEKGKRNPIRRERQFAPGD